MRYQGVVDLERKDGVPSALDDLLLTPNDIKVAVFIDVTDIACSQPSFPEGAVRLHAEVLTDDASATQEDLAVDTGRCLTLGIIEDEELGVDRDPNRSELALSRGKQVGAYGRRGLGKPIGFEQRRIEQVFQRPNRRWWKRRRGRAKAPQAAALWPGPFVLVVVAHGEMQCRCGGQQSGREPVQGSIEGLRREAVTAMDGGPYGERRQRACNQAVYVV